MATGKSKHGTGHGEVARQIRHLFGNGTVAGLEEWELLDRFVRSRDEAAFEALVIRFGPLVIGVCRRLLRDEADIADAFQATFLVLVRRAGVLRPGDLLGPWLHGVATRVALRRVARRRGGFDMNRPA